MLVCFASQIQAQRSGQGRKRRRRARKPAKTRGAAASSATADARMYRRHTAGILLLAIRLCIRIARLELRKAEMRSILDPNE
jgi:hypothetical protein